jgi:hypothetical protein
MAEKVGICRASKAVGVEKISIRRKDVHGEDSTRSPCRSSITGCHSVIRGFAMIAAALQMENTSLIRRPGIYSHGLARTRISSPINTKIPENGMK